MQDYQKIILKIMIPKTMKAAMIHAFGQPLHIEELPVRVAAEKEILVCINHYYDLDHLGCRIQFLYL